MYVYCIYDEDARLYFLGKRRGGLPVPTCVWGSDMADAIAFDSAMAATLTLRTIGGRGSIYRLRKDGKGPVRRVRGEATADERGAAHPGHGDAGALL